MCQIVKFAINAEPLTKSQLVAATIAQNCEMQNHQVNKLGRAPGNKSSPQHSRAGLLTNSLLIYVVQTSWCCAAKEITQQTSDSCKAPGGPVGGCAVGLGLGSMPGLRRPSNECNKFSSVLNHNVDAVAALLQYAVPGTLSSLRLTRLKSSVRRHSKCD